MDFLPGLIHRTIELMFLDPPPSISLDLRHFAAPPCVCVRVCTSVCVLAPPLTPEPPPTLSPHPSPTLSLSSVPIRKAIFLAVQEQLIDTKHFPFRTSSLTWSGHLLLRRRVRPDPADRWEEAGTPATARFPSDLASSLRLFARR